MNLRRVTLASAVLLVASLGVAAAADAPPPTEAAVTPTSKVVVFIEENHSLAQMSSGMPYLFGLAKTYGYANNWTAITHPSLPNYLAITGGSTFGVTSNDSPSVNAPKVGTAVSVFDQAIGAGKTAKMYVESMPTNCGLVPSGSSTTGYVVKHNPWPYFGSTTPRANCNSYDVPLTATNLKRATRRNRLPNVSMVVPNQAHDAHDGTLAEADNWLKTYINPMLASTDFTSGALTIIVTADEDDYSAGNKVLTVVMHTGMNGVVVTTALTHYSLSAYYSQIIGVTPLLNAKTAPSMAAAFGL